jgi:hypothetical protein
MPVQAAFKLFREEFDYIAEKREPMYKGYKNRWVDE